MWTNALEILIMLGRVKYMYLGLNMFKGVG